MDSSTPDSKLILIEGIPGSGKTTSARFVTEWLRQTGRESVLFLEGDLNHPADFESVARLDADGYNRLKTGFAELVPFLESQVTVDNSDFVFRYRHMQQHFPGAPASLIDTLAQHEIYELPAPEYRRLLVRRWQQFARLAAREDSVYVFECCFFQNPLTLMLGRHNEPFDEARALVHALADAVKVLAPRLIYLYQNDVRQTLKNVAQTRPPAWLEFVIDYHTRQGHGRAQGWQGFDGLVKFYEMRRSIELGLLPDLPFPGVAIEHRDWQDDHERIVSFLASR